MAVPDGDAGGGSGAADVRGVGDAADEQVRALVVAGRLHRVEVAPRLMRSPARRGSRRPGTGGRAAGRTPGAVEIDQQAMRMASVELAEQVVVAVNAALDDLRAQSRERMGAPRVDPERLQMLRDQSTEQKTAYARPLNALISSIQPR